MVLRRDKETYSLADHLIYLFLAQLLAYEIKSVLVFEKAYQLTHISHDVS
jgi:hypothetical protein